MSKQDVKKAAASAAENALMLKRVKLWRLIAAASGEQAAEQNGRLVLRSKADGQRVLSMRGSYSIKIAFGTPHCIADASGDPRLLGYVIRSERDDILAAIARQRQAWRQRSAA
jgi:hypothetical protein